MTLFNLLGIDVIPSRKYYFHQELRVKELVSRKFLRFGLNVWILLKEIKIKFSKRY